MQDEGERAATGQDWPNRPFEVGVHFRQRRHGNDIRRGTRKDSLGDCLTETPAAMTLVALETKGHDIQRLAPARAVPKTPPGRQFEPMQFKSSHIDCHVPYVKEARPARASRQVLSLSMGKISSVRSLFHQI